MDQHEHVCLQWSALEGSGLHVWHILGQKNLPVKR